MGQLPKYHIGEKVFYTRKWLSFDDFYEIKEAIIKHISFGHKKESYDLSMKGREHSNIDVTEVFKTFEEASVYRKKLQKRNIEKLNEQFLEKYGEPVTPAVSGDETS